MTTHHLTPRVPPTVAAAERIYVAGPMNGIADFNYPAFRAAAADLESRGFHVESPAGELVEGAPYDFYLRRAIGQLVTCDAVALLAGWRFSRGAKLEFEIAAALSMVVHPLTVWQQLRPVVA